MDPAAASRGSVARAAAGAPEREAGAVGVRASGAGGTTAAGAVPRGVRRERGGGGGVKPAAGGALGHSEAGLRARTMPTLDEALQRAGEFGRFQRRVFLLLCLTGVTFAFLFVAVVFLGSRPDHVWCRGPGAAALAERCGWSPEEEWNRTAPERGGHDRCQRFLLEAANGTAAGAALSCSDPLAAFPNRSAPLVPCRGGWRYAQAHSTIVSEVRVPGPHRGAAPQPARALGRGWGCAPPHRPADAGNGTS